MTMQLQQESDSSSGEQSSRRKHRHWRSGDVQVAPVVLINIVVLWCFQVGLGQALPDDVLSGASVSVIQPTGHGLLLRFFLPMHKRSVRIDGRYRCSAVDIHEAVPMAESLSLAFEILNEDGNNLGIAKPFEYALYDTCSAVPIVHSQGSEVWTFSSQDTNKYDRLIRRRPACSECSIPSAQELDKGKEQSACFMAAPKHTATEDTAPRQRRRRASGGFQYRVEILTAVGPLRNDVADAIGLYFNTQIRKVLHASPTPAARSFVVADTGSVRTTPSLDQHAEALMAVLAANNWTHVALLVSRDAVHQEIRSFVETKAQAGGICLALSLSVGADETHRMDGLVEFFQLLQSHPNLRTVVLLASESTTVRIWKEIRNYRLPAAGSARANGTRLSLHDWQWIGFQDWKYVVRKAVEGAGQPPAVIRISPKLLAPLPHTNLTWASVEKRLKRRLHTLKPQRNVLRFDPWLLSVWEEAGECSWTEPALCLAADATENCPALVSDLKEDGHIDIKRHKTAGTRNCTLDMFPGVAGEFLTDRSLRIMDTVFMVANVTSQIVREDWKRCTERLGRDRYRNCNEFRNWARIRHYHTNESGARTYLDNQFSLQNYSAMLQSLLTKLYRGDLQDFDIRTLSENGDWETLPQDLNFSCPGPAELTCPSPSLEISACPAQCESGWQRFYPEQLAVCCLACRRCPPNSVSSAATSHTCRLCPPGTYADPDQAECLVITVIHASLSDAASLVLLAISVPGALVAAATLAIFAANREKTVIRSADYVLSMMFLAALMLSFLCVPILLVKPSATVCILQLALVPIWPVVYVTCLAMKINRLRIVFQHTSRLSQRTLRFLSHEIQFLLVTGVFLITSSFLLSWAFISTPRPVTSGSAGKQILQCSLPSAWMAVYFAWTACLIAATSALAFLTRRLPGYYYEARYHFLAGATTLLWWLVLVPVYFFTEQAPSAVILAAIIVAQGCSIFCSLFVRRLYYLASPPVESKSRLLSSSASASSHRQDSGRLQSNTSGPALSSPAAAALPLASPAPTTVPPPSRTGRDPSISESMTCRAHGGQSLNGKTSPESAGSLETTTSTFSPSSAGDRATHNRLQQSNPLNPSILEVLEEAVH